MKNLKEQLIMNKFYSNYLFLIGYISLANSLSVRTYALNDNYRRRISELKHYEKYMGTIKD